MIRGIKGEIRKGRKKTPAPVASAGGAGLSFWCNKWGKGEEGIACSKCRSISSRIKNPAMPSSPSQLFPGGYAGVDGPMGQCFSRFPTFLSEVGESGKRRKKVRDRQEE